MLTILFYLFIGIVLIQIIYYISVFGNIAFRQTQNCTPKRIPVSVLVRVKDQADDLQKLLPSLINQNYPDFELVLINNASEDHSLEIMESYAAAHPNVKTVNVLNNEAFWGNKKYALTLGIKAAKNEYLLFIEPDTLPDSAQWIMNMSSQFTLNKTIVLGHNRILRQASWSNKLFRFQNTLKSTHLFSWALLGKPFSANERNLAYKRETFFAVNGFINHMNQPQSEAALFINQVAQAKNTTLCDAPTSFTATSVPSGFTRWSQRLRKDNQLLNLLPWSDQLKVRFFNISQLLFLLTAVVLFSFQFEWMIVLGLFIFRYLIVWMYMNKVFKKFNEKDLSYWFLPLEFIHTFTQSFVSVTHLFSKSKS